MLNAATLRLHFLLRKTTQKKPNRCNGWAKLPCGSGGSLNGETRHARFDADGCAQRGKGESRGN
jgi:hypothetical protein